MPCHRVIVSCLEQLHQWDVSQTPGFQHLQHSCPYVHVALSGWGTVSLAARAWGKTANMALHTIYCLACVWGVCMDPRASSSGLGLRLTDCPPLVVAVQLALCVCVVLSRLGVPLPASPLGPSQLGIGSGPIQCLVEVPP